MWNFVQVCHKGSTWIINCQKHNSFHLHGENVNLGGQHSNERHGLLIHC